MFRLLDGDVEVHAVAGEEGIGEDALGFLEEFG